MKILIVEDEQELALILKDYLQRDGYNTDIISNGLEALAEIKTGDCDLVLLDIMLPGMDGVEICKQVRQTSDVPIIMMTAKVEEVDRLIGLRIGADDYICKPYSPKEVVARVEALLRRSTNVVANQSQEKIRLVDENLSIEFNGQQAQLTLVEFNILKTLFRHTGKIFSRSELMDSAYNDHRIVSDRTIDSHIKKLRRKLISLIGDDILISVYGAGYKAEIPKSL